MAVHVSRDHLDRPLLAVTPRHDEPEGPMFRMSTTLLNSLNAFERPDTFNTCRELIQFNLI